MSTYRLIIYQKIKLFFYWDTNYILLMIESIHIRKMQDDKLTCTSLSVGYNKINLKCSIEF